MVCAEDRPPVLILGYRRFVEMSKIAELILPSEPCCLFVWIDGDEERAPTDLIRLRESLSRMCASSTNLHFEAMQENHGIANSLTTGMSAVFQNHRAAIVLEDDCLPSKGFYSFMRHSLNSFSCDNTIGMISGNSTRLVRSGKRYVELSSFPQTWGWATWREKWNNFDPQLSRFEVTQIDSAIDAVHKSPLIRKHWKDRVRDSLKDPNMWDAQWTVYMWLNKWRTINPSLELVSNVGFDNNATHTKVASIFLNAPLAINADLIWNKAEFSRCVEWSLVRKAQYFWALRLDIVQQTLRRIGLVKPAKLLSNLLIRISR